MPQTPWVLLMTMCIILWPQFNNGHIQHNKALCYKATVLSKTVLWLWKWDHWMSVASSITRSESSATTFYCGRSWLRGITATDWYAEIMWCNHGTMKVLKENFQQIVASMPPRKETVFLRTNADPTQHCYGVPNKVLSECVWSVWLKP